MTQDILYRALPMDTDYEIRTTSEGPRFTGYAAVFGVDSEPLPFTETIMAGAFGRSLGHDRGHTFVVDHDETRLLSSTRARTLTLSEDPRGLLVEASLPDTSYARDLAELHARGEARSMSFTFRVPKGGDTWSADQRRRTLTEVKLGHVSVLTGLPPAYRQTSASIRSLAAAISGDADALAEAIEDLREGRSLDADAVALLDAAIAQMRSDPPAAAAAVITMPLTIARARLALAARH